MTLPVIHVFVSAGEGQGIIAGLTPAGWSPFVCMEEPPGARLGIFREQAAEIAKLSGSAVRHLRYTADGAAVVEVFPPG